MSPTLKLVLGLHLCSGGLIVPPFVGRSTSRMANCGGLAAAAVDGWDSLQRHLVAPECA